MNPIIPLLILTVVTTVMVAGYVIPWIKHPREKGLNPLIKANCSLNSNIYGFNLHGLPGASRISLYDDFLVLSNFQKLVLNTSDIEKIHFQKNILSSDSITIKTNNKMKTITVSSSKAKKIYEKLKESEFWGQFT